MIIENLLLPVGEGKAEWEMPVTLNGKGYLACEITAKAPGRVRVQCSLIQGEHCLRIPYTVLSNCRVLVPFPVDLYTLQAGYFFVPPRAGVFKGQIEGTAVEPERVERLRLDFTGRGLESVEVHSLYFTEELPVCAIAAQPQLDEMGQRIRGEWPGKTHNRTQIAASSICVNTSEKYSTPDLISII